VECPSLSPDNRKLAFKRTRKTGGWGVHVLDLKTMNVVALTAETRSVDDQVEWLDDNTILYTLSDGPGSATPGENVWSLPLDGNAPRLHLPRATSPVRVP
jgi:Tol biopolymer transport system component